MSQDSNFFKFIFNEDTKNTIMNITQFSFISLIPLFILVKVINIIPDANENKGFLETLFEVLLQIVIMIVGSVIIVKFSSFFKPLSGSPYPELLLYTTIFGILLIHFLLHTKLSEKVFILKEKILVKIQNEKPKQTQAQAQTPSSAQSYSLSRQLQAPQTTPVQIPQAQAPTQQLPNYNQMYQQPAESTFEPFAANEALSGGFGTSF